MKPGRRCRPEKDVLERMKAIIMAGGEGTRLRPLTCDCPKPMIPLMNRPVMEYALRLLRRHGVEDVAVTLGYLPDAVTDHFEGGDAWGVRLRYYVENTPLGTAGGVRQAADFLDETFIALSGDGITDLDITAALAFHRAKRALATLVLKRVDDPLEYGVVPVDGDGRVTRFLEKPDWSDVAADTVNTGIYILEPEALRRIPAGRACDFGRELFPAMVAEGLNVFGYVMDGYWCDIGDVRAYLAAHADAMEGRIRLDGLAGGSGVVQMPGARVDKAAVLEGPCLIGPESRVEAGARIGPCSVLGRGCVVGAHASVKRSVLWDGAALEEGAQARGCALGRQARLGPGAQVYDGCALGTGASLGARASLVAGARLWPGRQAATGERVDANRVWGGVASPGFHRGEIALCAPEQATRFAQALCGALKPRELLTGRSGSAAAAALWHAVAAGAMAQGVQVLDAGPCTLPALSAVARRMGTDAALLAKDGALVPLNALGARLTAAQRRPVLNLYARQDYAVPFHRDAPPVLDVGGAARARAAEAARRFTADPEKAPAVALHAKDPLLLDLAAQAFVRAGLALRAEADEARMELAPGEVGVFLTDGGEGFALADESGALTEAEGQLLAAWTALERGEEVLLLPVSATRAAEALAEARGARVEYCAGDDAAWMNRLAEESAEQLALHFDGVAGALTALSALTEAGLSLAGWRAGLPDVHRRGRSVTVPLNRTGRILSAMASREQAAELGGGLRFRRGDGWAWVCPDEAAQGFRVVAEAASAETARELCDFCEAELKRLAGR